MACWAACRCVPAGRPLSTNPHHMTHGPRACAQLVNPAAAPATTHLGRLRWAPAAPGQTRQTLVATALPSYRQSTTHRQTQSMRPRLRRRRRPPACAARGHARGPGVTGVLGLQVERLRGGMNGQPGCLDMHTCAKRETHKRAQHLNTIGVTCIMDARLATRLLSTEARYSLPCCRTHLRPASTCASKSAMTAARWSEDKPGTVVASLPPSAAYGCGSGTRVAAASQAWRKKLRQCDKMVAHAPTACSSASAAPAFVKSTHPALDKRPPTQLPRGDVDHPAA